ncbi:MAG: twin-arginine translocase subunit TatC [Actinomycetota bacterium]|nr:twin-arginine translocase subunit TatC [Actinomycetota bacterium]MDA2970935.1 twin-arginine translocase subunit TatC [Actinomycetota bacterium]MDA3000079.1 twin-arginine translocase subunit TatC [Actinomycetota bacterium]
MSLWKFRRAKLATSNESMTLTEHLAELRTRIIRSMLAVGIGVIGVLAFYDPVLRFLRTPYDNLCERRPDLVTDCDLYSLGPLDGFTARMRIALFGGLILALPVLLWQIWRFIVPALHDRERRYAVPFIASSVILFLAGGALAFITLDKGLEFLVGWSGDDVQQAYQITKYVSLVALMIAAFGVGFEFPVLLVFLQLAGVVRPRQLIEGWRVAIVVIVVLAAVITPSGDPITLIALTVPLVVLYFAAVGLGHLLVRRRT